MQAFEVQIPKEPTRIWELEVPIITAGNTTTAFLTTDIGMPCEYDELIFMLDQAEEQDKFIIKIATQGGVLDSAIALSNAIKQSKAHVVAELTATVASAGTMVALACDEVVAHPHLAFMCHTYSGVSAGKLCPSYQ